MSTITYSLYTVRHTTIIIERGQANPQASSLPTHFTFSPKVLSSPGVIHINGDEEVL